jgi:hypothetical protein
LALEALREDRAWLESDAPIEIWDKNDEAITAIKQARALDKMAENARELGLDYEPAEVLGHNGWGFPIKAAAPVQKKCDCAAHSAADCVCGAWDKSAAAPVQEDWGPGPHECHSLTAAPVQEPVAWRYRGIFHEFDPSDWAEGPVTPLYTTPPAQPAPVQEPVAFFDPQGKGFYWAKPTQITAPVTVDVEPLPLYTTPPASQRQWVGLTNEEIAQIYLVNTDKPLKADWLFARAIERKLKELNT